MNDTHGLYLVCGSRAYRGHQPGETFEANIERNAERRAVQRRDIRLLERITPTIQPGSFTLPHGWLTQEGGR
jgi:hypothetical protein